MKAILPIISVSLCLIRLSWGSEDLCPWRTGDDLLRWDRAVSPSAVLSAIEVREDLACLKLLYRNYYIAQEVFPDVDLLSRVDAAIQNSKMIPAKKFVERIFEFHEGMYDLHLGFDLGEVKKRFTSRSEGQVSLDEDLDSETVYDRSKYVYFKPGNLFGRLSEGQARFVEFVSQNDRPIVLDLRRNGGGDDTFAIALVEALFTRSQSVPRTKLRQIKSPLVYSGLVNVIRAIQYRGVEDFISSVVSSVRGLPLSDLLPFEIEEETQTLEGKRSSAYASRITILIDSGCASSCETIVEKLSVLPNVRLVGSNTAGALHFSNPMMFQLPRSGILVRIPTLRHAYENDAPEGVGYSPNVVRSRVDLERLD